MYLMFNDTFFHMCLALTNSDEKNRTFEMVLDF